MIKSNTLKTFLKITDLSAEVDGKNILENINLEINQGETVVLLGKNGAGKSTLGSIISGNPKYKITSGKITFLSKNLLDLTPDKRALLGIFTSNQNQPEIEGVSTTELLKNALLKQGKNFSFDKIRARIDTYRKELSLGLFFTERDLNIGFSGGEKKKNEIIQLLVLSPKLAILDEIDSGLDIDSANKASELIAKLQQKTKLSLLIITHNMRILKHLTPDRVYILESGKIIKTGDQKLIEQIESEGFTAKTTKAPEKTNKSLKASDTNQAAPKKTPKKEKND